MTPCRRSPSARGPRRHVARGLTLVEMIVAVGVTMVVLVSAGAAFVRMGEA